MANDFRKCPHEKMEKPQSPVELKNQTDAIIYVWKVCRKMEDCGRGFQQLNTWWKCVWLRGLESELGVPLYAGSKSYRMLYADDILPLSPTGKSSDDNDEGCNKSSTKGTAAKSQ